MLPFFVVSHYILEALQSSFPRYGLIDWCISRTIYRIFDFFFISFNIHFSDLKLKREMTELELNSCLCMQWKAAEKYWEELEQDSVWSKAFFAYLHVGTFDVVFFVHTLN